MPAGRYRREKYLNHSAVVNELKKLAPPRDAVVSVGVFDGVHLGHARLLRRLVALAKAKDRVSIVITFTANPKALLNGGNHTLYLTDLGERMRVIKGLGVDLIAAIPPDHELFEISAEEFVDLLVRHLKMKGMVVGPDFALGKGREGDAKRLQALGEKRDFFVEVVPPEVLDGEIVSSTVIRQALVQGDLAKANRLLGRPFSVRGKVEAGTGKGSKIGFPTANVSLDEHYALPGDGVYCTRALFDNEERLSVTNIGFCPTLKGDCRTIEVHILDFKGDLYGKELRIELLSRLRGERKFGSVDELCCQIARDIESARALDKQRQG